MEGDFAVSVRFTGRYETLYDQAGLMLIGAGGSWMKTGIEFTDGLMHFSVVMTGPRSDWSVIPLPDATPQPRSRRESARDGDAVRVHYAVAGRPLAHGAAGAVRRRAGAGGR